MTVKEIFKKVDTYNKLAEELGAQKRLVRFTTDLNRCSIPAYSYKDFRDFVKDEYIDIVAKSILGCDRYEFDKAAACTVTDGWGYTFNYEITFWTEEV